MFCGGSSNSARLVDVYGNVGIDIVVAGLVDAGLVAGVLLLDFLFLWYCWTVSCISHMILIFVYDDEVEGWWTWKRG